MKGLIHEGDELREVNGVSLEHRKPKEIPSLLVRLASADNDPNKSLNQKGHLEDTGQHHPSKECVFVPAQARSQHEVRFTIIPALSKEEMPPNEPKVAPPSSPVE